VKDNLTGEVWDIHAKIIVNATGPYVDHIRLMNDPTAPKMIKPSNGTHIIIPQKFASKEAGILIPKTKDGRVLFLLPWENRVLAGTTDSEAELLDHPVPQQQEVDFILEELNRILAEPVTQNDVLSVWSGIRPLAKQLKVKENQSTKAISRDHVVEVSDNGLLTITGGKWTTYRKMAQDIVDRVENREEMAQRPKIKCFTDEVPLIGALGYNSAEVQEELKRKFHRYNKAEKKHHPFDDDIAEHLAHSYGSRAAMIGELAQQGYGQRLAPEHPFLEAEVVYCATNEYACTAVDVLARRTRLAFLDTNAARKALPRVIDLMATTLKWDAKRKLKEEDNALKFLETMHVNAPK
jgi:glycerol-3-phosphate dehydrogenase